MSAVTIDLVLTKDFDFRLRLDQYKIKSIGQDRVYGEDLSSLSSKTAKIRFPEGLEILYKTFILLWKYIKRTSKLVKGMTHLDIFHAHVWKNRWTPFYLGYFVTCKFYVELLSFFQSSLI